MLGDGRRNGSCDGQADGVPNLRNLIEDATGKRLLFSGIRVGNDEIGDCEQNCGGRFRQRIFKRILLRATITVDVPSGWTGESSIAHNAARQ